MPAKTFGFLRVGWWRLSRRCQEPLPTLEAVLCLRQRLQVNKGSLGLARIRGKGFYRTPFPGRSDRDPGSFKPEPIPILPVAPAPRPAFPVDSAQGTAGFGGNPNSTKLLLFTYRPRLGSGQFWGLRQLAHRATPIIGSDTPTQTRPWARVSGVVENRKFITPHWLKTTCSTRATNIP